VIFGWSLIALARNGVFAVYRLFAWRSAGELAAGCAQRCRGLPATFDTEHCSEPVLCSASRILNV